MLSAIRLPTYLYLPQTAATKQSINQSFLDVPNLTTVGTVPNIGKSFPFPFLYQTGNSYLTCMVERIKWYLIYLGHAGR